VPLPVDARSKPARPAPGDDVCSKQARPAPGEAGYGCGGRECGSLAEPTKRLDGLSGEPVSAPMREFLEWVSFRPRTYADAMAAWQSHCPRFTLWEDALEAGLIVLDPVRGCPGSASVGLTPGGRAALAATDTSAL
jgi:hypothetical protein